MPILAASRKNLLVILVVLAVLFLSASDVKAAGSVDYCDEAALDRALAGGGTVTFECSGTIVVTQSKVIRKDTILDGSGQRVTIDGKGIETVFEVHEGVDFQMMNLAVITSPFDMPFQLPLTGYPPPPPPPSEWLLMGIGGLALVIVSFVGGFFTKPRKRRDSSALSQ